MLGHQPRTRPRREKRQGSGIINVRTQTMHVPPTTRSVAWVENQWPVFVKNTPRILRARLNLPLSCASPASCMNNPFHTAPSPCIVAHSPTRREQTTYRPFTLHGCYAKKSATSHQESGHQHDREQASCNCHRWPRLPAASSCIARQHHH